MKKPRTHKPPASQPVNEQLAEHPTLAAAPTNPTDKMSKIRAALADAGSDGLDVGQLYRKAGAYLTDLDMAVKQGVIRQDGKKYFALPRMMALKSILWRLEPQKPAPPPGLCPTVTSRLPGLRQGSGGRGDDGREVDRWPR